MSLDILTKYLFNKSGALPFVVIIVSGNLFVTGGLQIYVRKLANMTIAKGINVVLVHQPKFWPEILFYPKGSHVAERHSACGNSYVMKNALVRQLVTFSTYVLVGTLLLFLKLRNRNVTAIHCHDPAYAGLLGLSVSKLTGVPLIVHVHSKSCSDGSNRGLSKFEDMLNCFVAKHSHAVITVSKDLAKYYLSLGISEQRLHVIPTGVQITCGQKSISSNKTCLELMSNDFVIGYVGRLDEGKNVGVLLESFRILNKSTSMNLKLLIVGNGPELPMLKQSVCNLGISEATIFTGFRSDVKQLLELIDIFVLPSLSEGSPLALFEAMVAGKAIIANDLPSIREILSNDSEAILVDCHNANELSSAIIKLSDDSQLRFTLGKNARKKAKLFDITNSYERILQLYYDVNADGCN